MIEKRHLGNGGPLVSHIGFGAGALEGAYGKTDDHEALRAIHRALDEGMMMFDTATAYGAGVNESRLGQALKGRRSEVFIGTKFGVVLDETSGGTPFKNGWGLPLCINGRPDFAKRMLNESLQRLGVDFLDLWTLHYPDPAIAIEETVGAMVDALKQGKVRHIGLSNVTAEQVRRAHAVHPITAVQYEYSLWRREAETDLLPTLRELGIALVAWSPLGQGFLAGPVALTKDDFRQFNPKYSATNLEMNQHRFATLTVLARELEITPAQLALAWLLHQGDDVFPIPGTRRADGVSENAKAATIKFDAASLRRIDDAAPIGLAVGANLL